MNKDLLGKVFFITPVSEHGRGSVKLGNVGRVVLLGNDPSVVLISNPESKGIDASDKWKWGYWVQPNIDVVLTEIDFDNMPPTIILKLQP